MKKLIRLLFNSILLIVALIASFTIIAAATGTITLSRSSASPGDTVTVTGVSGPDVWVAIKAVDSLGDILVFDTMKADNTGAYSFSFKVPESANGTLRISVGYGSNVASACLIVNRTSPNGGGSTPNYKADVKEDDGSETTILVTIDREAGTASVDISSNNLAPGSNVIITMPSVPGITSYSVGMLVASLTTPNGGTLTFNTDTGSLTLPSDMLSGITGAEGKKAEISIGLGDKSDLPVDIREAIGEKPLISMTLTLDGIRTEWNNPDAPVTVRIPYTPTAEELANPESIVVWYIDGIGRVVCVPNGRYDPVTGTVTFTTTHFSYFAVSYKPVKFNDVAEEAWYAKAVSFIAAREITTGTGNGNFSPEARLTRGQFIVMLMKAYGIAPDTNLNDNFSDAGNTYYTGYLAAAKRLGISTGVGNNMFAPEREITRMEMFTMLYNALKAIGQLPQGDSGKTLSDFSDADDIASWAQEAMKLLVRTGTVSGSDGRLMPQETTTRAQMAQILYNLLW